MNVPESAWFDMTRLRETDCGMARVHGPQLVLPASVQASKYTYKSAVSSMKVVGFTRSHCYAVEMQLGLIQS
jgi:hypothetical protein